MAINWNSALQSGVDGAASSIGSGIFSDAMNLLTLGSMQRNQNALNRNLQRDAMRQQAAQFAASLQHDSDMSQQNAFLQAWLMGVQDDLNSPERLVQKLMRAGVSPAAVFGSGSPLGNVGSQSVHGSSISPSVPMPGGSHLNVAVPSQFVDGVSKMLQAIGGNKLNTAEADKIRALLPSMVEKGIIDVQLMQENLISAQLRNYVERQVKDVHVKKYTQEWLNDLQDYYVKIATEEKVISDVDLNKLLAKGQAITNLSNDFRLKHLLVLEVQSAKEQIKALQTQQRLGSSQAEYYGALSKTENDIRQWQVDLSHYNALIAKSNHTVLNGTEQQRMNEIVNRALASDLLPQQVAEDLRAAQKDNDWYEVKRIMDIVDSGIRGYSAYKGAGFQEGMVNSWDVRNRISEEYNSWMRDNDVDETVVYQQDNRGRVKSQQRTFRRRRPSRR